MHGIRRPAVAGSFYPARPAALRAAVEGYLRDAGGAEGPAPKAVIAPHAGYVYSGPVAASVYARLAPLRGQIERVVLLGPAHRVRLRGLALPAAEAFETPLGRVEVDRAARALLRGLAQVVESEAAHAEEHSLEVHLPFLQATLGRFHLVPLVVGDASPDEVAEVLGRLWGGPETLIVVSSDLSHYLDYASARAVDARTTGAIEALAPEALEFEQACGCIPVQGLLQVARAKGLQVETLDVRSSGDTAGPRDRVVGYGAYAFC